MSLRVQFCSVINASRQITFSGCFVFSMNVLYETMFFMFGTSNTIYKVMA